MTDKSTKLMTEEQIAIRTASKSLLVTSTWLTAPVGILAQLGQIQLDLALVICLLVLCLFVTSLALPRFVKSARLRPRKIATPTAKIYSIKF